MVAPLLSCCSLRWTDETVTGQPSVVLLLHMGGCCGWAQRSLQVFVFGSFWISVFDRSERWR